MYIEQQKTLITNFGNKDWRASEHLIFKRKVWGGGSSVMSQL